MSALPVVFRSHLNLMELGGELLAGPLAEGLFDELAGIAA